MATETLNSRDRSLIRDLMERGSRTIGLRLCFHDILRRTGLPKEWQQHENPPCLAVKARHQNQCAAFCGRKIEQTIAGLPDGSIHTCPFGHIDIAAPVWLDGLLAGVIYAGVCWGGDGEPPRDGFVVPESRQWLEDRRLMLCALGRQLAFLLRGGEPAREQSRREQISAFLDANLHEPVRLGDLANELSLSPSRTGHLVREIFNESFSRLLLRLRLARAAHRLCASDTPIGEIALDTGFADQSHFTRSFTRHYHASPLKYRKAYRVGV